MGIRLEGLPVLEEIRLKPWGCCNYATGKRIVGEFVKKVCGKACRFGAFGVICSCESG